MDLSSMGLARLLYPIDLILNFSYDTDGLTRGVLGLVGGEDYLAYLLTM